MDGSCCHQINYDNINNLEPLFARFGLPVTVVNDNGPQFRGAEFSDYMTTHGIQHRRVTPYWPQANGQVERQNRTLLKALRTATAEGKNWRKELLSFLLVYRSTPHSVTGASPAELMFRRSIRTKMPSLTPSVSDPEVRAQDATSKQKGKEYADKRRKAAPRNFSPGDQVLLRQEKNNKVSTYFEHTPYTVVFQKGNIVVLRSSKGQVIQRNVAHDSWEPFTVMMNLILIQILTMCQI